MGVALSGRAAPTLARDFNIAAWVLKQVQHDGGVLSDRAHYAPRPTRHPELVSGPMPRSAPRVRITAQTLFRETVIRLDSSPSSAA